MRKLPRWIDGFWLALLAAYILAGAALAPFHGDESTLIFMGRDYHYLLVENDLSKVAYDPQSPRIDDELRLRLHNGTISKMLYGWVMASGGKSLEDYQADWDWRLDFDQNIARGGRPDETVLQQARAISAAQLALVAWLFFWLARTSLNRQTAYIASAFFALHPSILINGRRAMMEGSHLLGLILLLLAARALTRQRSWRRYALLGLAAGFAVAAKHTNALAVCLIFAVCALDAGYQPYAAAWRRLARNMAGLAVAGLAATLTFLQLNPAWWRFPIESAGLAITLRLDFLQRQAATSDGFRRDRGKVAEPLRLRLRRRATILRVARVGGV